MIDAMLSQYGGGVSMERIRRILRMPMVTVIRLMGCMKRRLNPQATPPGMDVDPDMDAAIVAMLEKRRKAL